MIAASSTFPTSEELLDPIVRRIVGRKIDRLVRACAISRQDAGDIEHDLYIRLLKSWPAFDPEQSHRYAFVTTVVERSIATLLRDRRAAKRDPARIEPLKQDVPADCEAMPNTDLTLDVAAVLDAVPSELRELAEQLKNATVSQVARDTNVSRKAVYRQVRELRKWFLGAGLGQEN